MFTLKKMFLGFMVVCLGVALATGAQGIDVYPGEGIAGVQAAVDAGGTVVLKAGTFEFGTGHVVINNDVVITGELGPDGEHLTTIVGGGASLTMPANPDDPAVRRASYRGVFTVMPEAPEDGIEANYEISNIHFDSSVGMSVMTFGARGCLLSNNIVTNPIRGWVYEEGFANAWVNNMYVFLQNPALLVDANSDRFSGDLVFEDNVITFNEDELYYPDPGGDGLGYCIQFSELGYPPEGPSALQYIIRGNNFINALRSVVILADNPGFLSPILIENNLFDNVRDYSTRSNCGFTNCDNVKVLGNTFTGKQSVAIHHIASDNTAIEGNSIDLDEGSSYGVLVSDGGKNIFIRDNDFAGTYDIVNSYGSGPIRIDYAEEVTIEKNDFTGYATSGIILIRNSHNNTVTDNTIHDFTLPPWTYGAIDVSWAHGNTISKNTFSGVKGGQANVVLYDADYNMLVNNEYTNDTDSGHEAGVVIEGDNNQVTNDNFMGSYDGWDEPYVDENGDALGQGCVLMELSASNNRITALKNGTPLNDEELCRQVLDVPDAMSVYYIDPNIPQDQWNFWLWGSFVTQGVPIEHYLNRYLYDYWEAPLYSAGFEDLAIPTSANLFDRSTFQAAPSDTYVLWGYWRGYYWYDPAEWYNTGLPQTDATLTITWPGGGTLEVPDPNSISAVSLILGGKSNDVPGYQRCLKPEGFIEAMQKKAAKIKRAENGPDRPQPPTAPARPQ